MGEYAVLTYGQVALAALLISVNGAISVALHLRMERLLLIAGARTVIQLLLVGMVLEWVFRWKRWYVIIGLAMVMTLIAGITAASNNQRRYPGIWIHNIISLWASAWIVTSFALFAILQGNEWRQPQYAIPLLGMVLGNTLNGISVGLATFTESLVARREQIESLLALGASRWEAAREAVRHAVRTGMLPIINSMMVVGIVSLPGMMTGQLISGMSPIQAVKYQIVIMFLIALATSLGTVGVVLLAFSRLFTPQHQYRRDVLHQREGNPRGRV
uniref:Putative ABC transport system permease protein n=1 Tax=Candidatus Kentrum sp. LPFa TaxID=2126335 RepID=A0A450WKE1_9GAMM|nr:MAG: putative ABC transport system permease protein [Candidatus Kentron sp. LPFa]VFK34590.1 MAG: putative ABC transport system permease protein [Candidatus Kentron sp. LPFa]